MFRTALILLTLTSLMGFATGQENMREITVEVRRDGKPAPDATVQLVTTEYTAEKSVNSASKPVKVDGNGKVTLKAYQSSSVLVNDPKGNTGGVSLDRSEEGLRPQTLVIDLFPPETISGRFVDSRGKPITDMKLEVERVFRVKPVIEGKMHKDYFPVNPDKNWKLETDGDGRFSVEGLPLGYHAFIRFDSTKHGRGNIRRAANDREDIVLKEPGKLKIEIQSVKTVGSLQGFTAYFVPQDQGTRKEFPPNFSGVNTVWDEQGQSGPILPDSYTVSVYKDSQSDFCIDRTQSIPVKITSGEVTVLKIPAYIGARFSGRVVEQGQVRGMKGIEVVIFSEDQKEHVSGITDEQGRYSILVQGGTKYLLGFGQKTISDGERKFLKPAYSTNYKLFKSTPSATVAPGEKHEFPTVELREALTVIGNDIDAEAKPVKSEVKVYCPVNVHEMRDYQPQFTGNQFSYRGLPHDVPLTFRLRSGKAVNIPEKIDPKFLGEPQTFRLSEAHGVKIVGSVLNGKKEGVAGAKVTLTWGYAIQDSDGLSTSTQVEVVRTDAMGAYVFEGWWPKERYYITVEGEGFGKIGGDWNATKTGEPGSTITFEPFIVNPLKQDIAGQVRHQDGTPVAGATVQTAGETPKPVTATTDAEGRYSLKGLPEMTLFVTVAKPGYRPTYVIHDTSKPSLNLSLRRTTEAPAPAPEISVKFLAERKQAIIDMLEMVWAKRAEHGYGSSCFTAMQRLDPARAKAWVEAATGEEAVSLKKRFQAQIPEADLLKLAVEDVDEAIARIGKDRTATYTLRSIAEKVLAKDKPVALRLIEESTIIARKAFAQDPMRLPSNLAMSAVLAHEAGNVAGAKKLFAEAIELVDKIADAKNRGIACGWVAGPLGKVDLAAAKEQLAKCEDPYYHNAAVSTILVHIAKTDSQAAIENLKLLKTDRSRAYHTEKLLIAVTIAEREPENAIKLVEGVETTVDRVRGYMELAKVFAVKDKPKAWRLIDKAFDLMEKDPAPFGLHGSSGGIAGAAAQVAYQAKKIDYPDLHSLISRLFIMRSQEGTFTQDWRNKVILCLVISPLDPVAARTLLRTMFTDDGLLNSTKARDRNILFVLGMTDPVMCKKVVEAKLKTTLNANTLSGTGIVEMLGSMAATGREIESLGTYAGGMYRPLSEER
jgi:hypothetical protein